MEAVDQARENPVRGESTSAVNAPDDPTGFNLRVTGSNPLIDQAVPLLGMVLRARRMTEARDVEALHRQVSGEMTRLSAERTEAGMDRAELMAYRYVLCAFIDEAILSTPWGSFSIWAQHSMLSRFHNETWGGEKVFAILGKLEREPKRYRDLLGFIYLCLCLGFEGQYRVRGNDRSEYEAIRDGLYQTLYGEKGARRTGLGDALAGVIDQPEPSRRGIPTWSVFAVSGLVLVVVYGAYRFVLNEHIQSVLAVLEALPH